MAIQFGGNQGEMRLVLRVKDDGSIVVDKFADNVDKSAKKSGKAFDDFSAGAGISFRSVATYAGLAAAAVVAGGIAMVKNQIDVADATGKAAAKLGTTSAAVSALAYQARLAADLDLPVLTQSLQTMLRNISDAAQGVGEARYALLDLGLDARKLSQMKPEQALAAIADQLDKLPNQFDKLRIAQELLRNTDIVNVLRGGSAEMRRFYEEAQKAGAILSDETTAAAGNFNDEITRLSANMQGFANRAIGPTLTALKSVAHVALGLSAGLDSLGKRIGALTASAVSAAKLNFSEAREILRLYAKDRKQIEADLKKELDALWAEPPPAPKPPATSQSGDAPPGSGSRARAAREEEEARAAADAARKRAEAAVEERVRMFEQVEALRESLMTERELIERHEADKQLLLFEAWEQRLVTDQQYEQMREELELQHQAKLGNIEAQGILARRQFEQMNAKQKTQFILSEMVAITQGVATQNKALFKINKIATMASLAVSAPDAIGKAVAKAGGLPWGAWAGVLTAAKYAALIAQANSANFGSATSAPSVAGGTATPVEPVGGPPAVTPFPQQGTSPSQNITQVIFYGDVLGSEHFVQETLIPVLKREIGNRDVVLISGNSRQAAEIRGE